MNVLGTCNLPFGIKIVPFSQAFKVPYAPLPRNIQFSQNSHLLIVVFFYEQEASYEPELHPGVTYKLKQPKATLKVGL